ncbi:MAG TPA: 4a-hydroxytetrahydrobiopterin dehydratase [Anaerolineaceae bacterium]|nr:4a-hydroxytetrahydrobiopterin dehydratase [Anaerolineaceae bacterium]
MNNIVVNQEEPIQKLLTQKEKNILLNNIPGWEIIHEDSMNKLMRSFTFENFSQVLAFTQLIENLAKQENHHPVIKSSWGKVTIYWWTHAIHVIQEKDFQMAEACNNLYDKILAEEDLWG